VTWDVRTNIKAKPGSQGTLFQGGSEQMTDAKWPKHYTPERLHEVLPHVAPYKHGAEGVHDAPAMFEYDTGSERRKLVDTVARSTVPAHHMLGVQFKPGAQVVDMGTGTPGEYASGDYKRSHPSSPARIRITRGHAETHTPIHEIGHHVSFDGGLPDRGVIPYTTAGDRGHEEGKADAYAQEHYRDRRGRPTQVGTYSGGRESDTRPPAFYAGYHQARGTSPLPQWQQDAARRDANRPKDRVLPGLDLMTIVKAQPKGTMGNRGFK